MRVYHVSSAPITGGAARAGLRLHSGLRQMDGIESLWLDAGGLPDAPGAKHLDVSGSPAPLRSRIRRSHWRNQLRQKFFGTRTPYSSPFGWGSYGSFRNLPVPDIWNLHWVSQFLDWERLLPWMAAQAPIVWTLHDLNPLMGVWHYVPFAEELNEERNRMEQKAIAFKKQALSLIPKNRLTFVGPSKWMVQQCRQSQITCEYLVEHIPYGLDTEVFAPRDSETIRGMYAIPKDVFVIGFIADNVTDPRKGMKPLLQALVQIARGHPDIHLVTVGNGVIESASIAHTHLGPIHNDRLLSFFYSACDIFACPSLQDNLPNTVLEAMACGTPVVAYQTGGLPDMVKESETGQIAENPGDPDSLRRAIERTLHPVSEAKRLGRVARMCATSEYPLAGQAARYNVLYHSLQGTIKQA